VEPTMRRPAQKSMLMSANDFGIQVCCIPCKCGEVYVGQAETTLIWQRPCYSHMPVPTRQNILQKLATE
jgi:hypothetical protein